MLWNASVIKDYAIAASDGLLGTVSERGCRGGLIHLVVGQFD